MAARKERTGTVNARQPVAKPATKSDRIAFIVSLMAQNLWVTGVTGPELAAEWGLSVETLSKDAQEASRQFDVPAEERADRRARWYAKIEGAQAQAARSGRLEALASLLKLEGDHLGSFEPDKASEKPQRIEVVFTDTPLPAES